MAKPKHADRPRGGTMVGVGLAAGAGIGIVAGTLFNAIAIGAVIGAALGAVLGAGWDQVAQRSNESR